MRRAWGLALILVAATVPPLSCEAQEEWVRPALREQARFNCEWFGNCERWYRYVHWRERQAQLRAYRRAEVYGPQVRGYIQRDDDDRYRERDRAQCIPGAVIDVLSTEHTTEDNAREAAKKLWMAKVQWVHGGQFMDLDQAAEVRWMCGPSNAHDTFSGRIAEAAGTITGRGGQNVRCSLFARPCRAPREREADRRSRR